MFLSLFFSLGLLAAESPVAIKIQTMQDLIYNFVVKFGLEPVEKKPDGFLTRIRSEERSAAVQNLDKIRSLLNGSEREFCANVLKLNLQERRILAEAGILSILEKTREFLSSTQDLEEPFLSEDPPAQWFLQDIKTVYSEFSEKFECYCAFLKSSTEKTAGKSAPDLQALIELLVKLESGYKKSQEKEEDCFEYEDAAFFKQKRYEIWVRIKSLLEKENDLSQNLKRCLAGCSELIDDYDRDQAGERRFVRFALVFMGGLTFVGLVYCYLWYAYGGVFDFVKVLLPAFFSSEATKVSQTILETTSESFSVGVNNAYITGTNKNKAFSPSSSSRHLSSPPSFDPVRHVSPRGFVEQGTSVIPVDALWERLKNFPGLYQMLILLFGLPAGEVCSSLQNNATLAVQKAAGVAEDATCTVKNFGGSLLTGTCIKGGSWPNLISTPEAGQAVTCGLSGDDIPEGHLQIVFKGGEVSLLLNPGVVLRTSTPGNTITLGPNYRTPSGSKEISASPIGTGDQTGTESEITRETDSPSVERTDTPETWSVDGSRSPSPSPSGDGTDTVSTFTKGSGSVDDSRSPSPSDDDTDTRKTRSSSFSPTLPSWLANLTGILPESYTAYTWELITANGAPGSPPPRCDHGLLAAGNNLYVFYGSSSSILPGVSYNDVWRFNGSNWFNITQNGTQPAARSSFGAGIIDNSIFMFGGNGIGVSLPSPVYGDSWLFNLISKNWSQTIGQSPPPRHAPAAAAVGNCFYKFGGWNGAGNNDLWKYNGSWFNVVPASSPPVQWRVRMTTVGANIYLLDGSTSYVWQYNGSNWNLFEDSSLVPARVNYAMGAIGDEFFVFGGGVGPNFGDLWKFNVVTKNWVQIDQTSSIFPGLRGFNANFANINNDLYLFGGKTTEALNDLWRLHPVSINLRNISLNPNPIFESLPFNLSWQVNTTGGSNQHTATVYLNGTQYGPTNYSNILGSMLLKILGQGNFSIVLKIQDALYPNAMVNLTIPFVQAN